MIAFFGFACLAAVLSATNRSLGLLSIVAGGAPFLVVVLFLIERDTSSTRWGPAFETGFLGPAVRRVHRLRRRHRVDRRRHPHIGAEEVVKVAFDDMQGEQ